MISQNVGVNNKDEPHDKSIKVVEFGLEDDDETMGVEREAALKSPPKGKIRVSSAVSEKFPPPHLFTNLFKQKKNRRVLLKTHRPSPHRPELSGYQRRSATTIFQKVLTKGCGDDVLYQHTCSLLHHNPIPGTFRLP
jgi:hypothetical protein